METKYDFTELKNYLDEYFTVKISENAGNYLCNNIYYNGLKYIYEQKLITKMIFLHISLIKNIDIKYFSNIITKYIMKMGEKK